MFQRVLVLRSYPEFRLSRAASWAYHTRQPSCLDEIDSTIRDSRGKVKGKCFERTQKLGCKEARLGAAPFPSMADSLMTSGPFRVSKLLKADWMLKLLSGFQCQRAYMWVRPLTDTWGPQDSRECTEIKMGPLSSLCQLLFCFVLDFCF